MIQGSWRDISFTINSNTVIPIEDLSASFAALTDSVESDVNEHIEVKGSKLRTASFTVRPSLAVGVNPEKWLEDLAWRVGISAPLYIGGRRLGPPYFMLEKVDASEFIIDNFGRIVSNTLSLSFIEDRDGRRAAVSTMFGTNMELKQPPELVARITANKFDKAYRK